MPPSFYPYFANTEINHNVYDYLVKEKDFKFDDAAKYVTDKDYVEIRKALLEINSSNSFLGAIKKRLYRFLRDLIKLHEASENNCPPGQHRSWKNRSGNYRKQRGREVSKCVKNDWHAGRWADRSPNAHESNNFKLLKKTLRNLTTARRSLPIRGKNTISTRGVNGLVMTRNEIKSNIITQFKNLTKEHNWPQCCKEVFFQNYDIEIKENNMGIKVDMLSAIERLGNKNYVQIFDVYYPNGGHVFACLFLPKCMINHTKDVFLFLDTFLTPLNYLNAIKDSIHTSWNIDTYFCPRIEYMFQYNLQSHDTCLRGQGQCQYWSLMCAYVFLKTFTTQNSYSMYDTKTQLKMRYYDTYDFLTKISNNQSKYNELQREIGIV